MSHGVPVTLDQNGEDQGLWALFTNQGPIVVVGEKGPRFDEFLALATRLEEASGHGRRVGYLEFGAPSFAAAVNTLLSAQPDLAHNTTFIEVSDPVFDDLLIQMRRDVPPGH